jgi:hypothetical protein
MLRWRYWEIMWHNATMKILGDYATQCYDEDSGRLCDTMLRWRFWEIMRHNATMKILGDYATQCYNEDFGRLRDTMLRWRYWETMRHNARVKIMGDYATQCYDEVGRGSSLNRGEQMMKCFGTGGLCSLLRHREQGSILRLHCNISWTAETSPQDSAREKRQMTEHLPCLGSWVTSSSISRAPSYTPLLHEPVPATGNYICHLT